MPTPPAPGPPTPGTGPAHQQGIGPGAILETSKQMGYFLVCFRACSLPSSV